MANTLVELKALQHFRVQLAPDPRRSRLLDDDDFVGKGNLSLRDCWSEVEKCYEELVKTLLVAPDVVAAAAIDRDRMAAAEPEEGPAREDTSQRVTISLASEAAAKRPRAPLHQLRLFTSEDYKIPAMGEIIDATFVEHGFGLWVKSSGDGWMPAG